LLFEQRKATGIFISLSHTADHATAIAVLEG
jgi:phosphopantetheinyl transferase (holo-ACP synthase)